MKRKKTATGEALDWFDPRNAERFALLGAAAAIYTTSARTADAEKDFAAAGAAAVRLLDAVDNAAADAADLHSKENPE